MSKPESQAGRLCHIQFLDMLLPYGSLEELQRFALETLDVTVKLLLSRAEFSVDEAIGHAIDFASRVSNPLFSKLDTEKVAECSRALELGKEYGERLLKRYSKFREGERDRLLERLIRGYPSHGYIIDYKELSDMGLDVELPSDPSKPIIEKMTEHLLESGSTEIVFIEKGCSCEVVPKKPTRRSVSDAST